MRVWPVKLWFSASLDSVGSKFPDDALAGGVSVSVLWMFPNKISLIFQPQLQLSAVEGEDPRARDHDEMQQTSNTLQPINNPRSTSISPLNKIPKSQPRPKNVTPKPKSNPISRAMSPIRLDERLPRNPYRPTTSAARAFPNSSRSLTTRKHHKTTMTHPPARTPNTTLGCGGPRSRSVPSPAPFLPASRG